MPNPNLPINFRKNTYIGARYVPKFSDTHGSEWDNSIQYEPLTIVLYQGNSYTSKTFVPIGVDINNETYWAQSGNYDAQVESYRKEVLEVKEQIENVENQLTDSRFLPTYGMSSVKRRFVIVGDSYTSTSRRDGVLIDNWTELFKTFYPTSDFYVSAIGGSYIAIPGLDEHKTFTDLLNEILPSIPDPSTITDVFIVTAGNDSGRSSSDIVDGMASLDNLISKNFPNAQVNLFCVAAYIRTNSTSKTLSFNGIVCENGATRGWVVHNDTYKVLHMSIYMSSDWGHPNQQGMYALARNIMNQYNGSNTMPNGNFGRNIQGDITGIQWLSNDAINTQFNDSIINKSFTLTGQYVKVGRCLQWALFNVGSNNSQIIWVLITTSEGKKLIPMSIQFRVETLTPNTPYIPVETELWVSTLAGAISYEVTAFEIIPQLLRTSYSNI